MADETIPSVMKAWTFSQAGPHRKVLSQTTIPTPSPPTGDEILIKVAYAGLQFGDLKRMIMTPSFLRPKDSVPGCNYAGTIIARGPQAPSRFAIGTEVFGMVGSGAMSKGTGSLCEYLRFSTSSDDIIAPVPENWSMEDAASVAIGGVMALLICKKGGIGEDCGMRMLIHGASGGCGTAFVQVAKAMGAREIVATCSTPNFELVKSLGADGKSFYILVGAL